MAGDFTIRAPRDEDLPGLVSLRIEWAALDHPPSEQERDRFRTTLHSWIARMGDSAVCRIAVEAERVVGMAWLVVYDRVPNIDDPTRRAGDIQSVYVLPDRRGRGIGRALIDAVLAEADGRGVPRVTVHSSTRAVPLYESAGFEVAATLLGRRRPG